MLRISDVHSVADVGFDTAENGLSKILVTDVPLYQCTGLPVQTARTGMSYSKLMTVRDEQVHRRSASASERCRDGFRFRG